eukprot:CCRYP_006326-RA/>CCRYP_006326-RA protein AED:0.02 eAED:0.02 QI:328/1/1/1/1/1/2/235/475
MKFAAALLSAAVSVNAMELDTNVDIPATSRLGSRLLSKARMLEGNNDQSYTSWVAGYSIKFDRCVSSQNYYGGYFASNEGQYNGDGQYNYNYDANAQWQNGEQQMNNNNNYDANAQYQGQANGQNANGQYNNGQGQQAAYYQQAQPDGNRALENNNQGYYYDQGQNREGYNGMYQQRLVHFKLCPSNSCRSCKNGADYVVDLNEFIDAMMEAKLTAQEYNCERVKENCWCEQANNKDYCLASCFTNANMDYCNEMQGNNNNGQAQNANFDMSEALKCTELDVDEDFMSNYYFKNRKANQGHYNEEGKYYVGPYCSSNGKKILLGLFEEETCSYPAPSGTFEALNYGQKLPYSQKSLIDNSCISCMEPKEQDNKNYWDAQDDDEVTDVCERMYEMSGKCEENLQGLPYGVYPDNMGCDFVKSIKSASMVPTAIPAKVFAGLFAATTVLLGALTVNLYKKSQRNNVNLVADSAHPLE